MKQKIFIGVIGCLALLGGVTAVCLIASALLRILGVA